MPPRIVPMPLEYSQRQRQLQRLLRQLGVPESAPVQWSLIDRALTHPTASPTANYEQLEFVGDAVVRLAVSEYLMEHHGDLPVGEFAAIRSILVSDRLLAQLARIYTLERYLVAAGSAHGDRHGQTSRLADSFEALLGALYLSTHSLELIRPWLHTHLPDLIAEVRRDPARQNYKAALQEWTQGHYKVLPEYRVTEQATEGIEARFQAQVWVQGECRGTGQGRSIKAAEQAAAQMAYRALMTASGESP